MAITDLTGTTWVFNDSPSVLGQIEDNGFDINFTSNNTNFNRIKLGHDGPLGTVILYLFKDSSGTSGNYAYEQNLGGWTDNNYKTINITGGTDATNVTLIALLQNNATLVSSPIQKIDQIKCGDVVYDIDLPPDALINIDSINGLSADAIKNSVIHTITSASSVAGSSTSGAYLSVRWYVNGINGVTTPYDGMKVSIKIPRVGVSTAGVILSLNGNSADDYHPVVYNVNTLLTSQYAANTYKLFVYDASASATCYKTSNTSSTVTGIWKADADYDSNTTITYGTLAYYFRPYAAAQLYRYKLGALTKDNRFLPFVDLNVLGEYAASTTYAANDIVTYSGVIYKSLSGSNKGNRPDQSSSKWQAQAGFTPTSTSFRPDKIYWYNTTTNISANSVLGGNTLMDIGYNATNIAVCNFNGTVPAYRLIYYRGTFDQTTGLFTLDGAGTAGSTDYYTFVPDNTANITLSSYFVAGKDYILMGASYSSANYIHLRDDHPMYRFDGTNLLPYDTYHIKDVQSKIPTFNLNDGILTITVNGVNYGN